MPRHSPALFPFLPSVALLQLFLLFATTPSSSSTAPYLQQQQQQGGDGGAPNSRWLLHFYKRLLSTEGARGVGEHEEGAPQQHVQDDEDEEKHRIYQCLDRSASCNPWLSRCCDGLECLSYSREMCMSPTDNCACLPPSYRMRQVQTDLWYRRRR